MIKTAPTHDQKTVPSLGLQLLWIKSCYTITQIFVKINYVAQLVHTNVSCIYRFCVTNLDSCYFINYRHQGLSVDYIIPF